MSVFLTGSGADTIAREWAAPFIQEVNALTLAVEQLYPDVGAAIEIGGQDSKLVVFRTDPSSGVRHSEVFMNDKCASGTGVVIERCLAKLGITNDTASSLPFSEQSLFSISAKCGVFAETDLLNLLKCGAEPQQLLCSLADAIVTQNLTLLGRTGTLLPRVMLLGGPHYWFPWLVQCWQARIMAHWRDRGSISQRDLEADDLVFTPRHALFFPAYGAVLYGLQRGEVSAWLGSVERLRAKPTVCVAACKQGPALVSSEEELEEFLLAYAQPTQHVVRCKHGGVLRGFLGIDAGSTSTKAVLIDEHENVLCKSYRLSQGNPVEDVQGILAELVACAHRQRCRLEIRGLGVTGYAADFLSTALNADVRVVETVAHMLSAQRFFPDVDVICDIGGQDIKVLFLRNGEISSFKLSNQCAAGNGMLLQTVATRLSIPLEEYATYAFRARAAPLFSAGCGVFAEAELVTFQRQGWNPEGLLAGLARVLPKNIWQYVVQAPRLHEYGRRFVLQGGTQLNLAAVKAQVDYISSRVAGAKVSLHPHPGEAGALGAAVEALLATAQAGSSTFIGLEAAQGLRCQARSDESTRCSSCSSRCARTMVELVYPEGASRRFYAGGGCENGLVGSPGGQGSVLEEQRAHTRQALNLVAEEAQLVFGCRDTDADEPAAPDSTVGRRHDLVTWASQIPGVWRPRRRSSQDRVARRQQLRIGMPRVLNLYSTAPWFVAYFSAVGIAAENIVFSGKTTKRLCRNARAYQSVDACFPAKVCHAHVHALLSMSVSDEKLDYLFFPCITHLPTWISPCVDSMSCPLAAGTPNVVKATFTKERDLFAENSVDYVDPVLGFREKRYLEEQMFETWGHRLELTRNENRHACRTAWSALESRFRQLRRRGQQLLDQAAAADTTVILALCRPYHHDPGLNHGVLRSLQKMGYPILSISSIPVESNLVWRLFAADVAGGFMDNLFDVRDVWPECYSTHSMHKVWAAKFAARHPRVAIVDISSFKCGQDAPVYGIVDGVVRAADVPCLSLHDLDATAPRHSLRLRLETFVYSLEQRTTTRHRPTGEDPADTAVRLVAEMLGEQ